MVPKLLFVILFGVFAYADRQPLERTARVLNGRRTNSTYGYQIPGKNTAFQGHAELRTGERIQGNFVVQQPEEQSVSDVQYTADARGFHPIVRLSTKSNHSQVTSHFALGQSAVEKLNEQNEKTLEIPPETKNVKRDSTDKHKDTIIQVLESLFPYGIPSKYSILVNSTEGLNFEESTEDTFTTTQSTTEISSKEARGSKDFRVYDQKRFIYGNNTKRKIFHNYYFDSSKKLPDSPRKLQNLVSDQEVLQINDAAENYTEEVVKQIPPFTPTSNSHPSVTKLRPIDQTNTNVLYPFESPIVVEDIHNDNSVSPSQENGQSFIVPSNEINIRPSREQFLNSDNIEPDRQINVRIIEPELNEVEFFKTGLLRAATAHDLDAFQKIVEDSFSRSENFNTEAPSRVFLRKFKEKAPKSLDIEVENDDNDFVPAEIDRSGTTTAEFNEEQEQEATPPQVSRNENTEDTSSTTISPSRPRGKTFVEIQKAVNIQNLLIKEDADSIERHEEYLQPLAVGRRLTHRIETKFMKEKPWESTKKQPISRGRTVDPVTIESSISYPIEQRDQTSLEYQESNANENENYEDNPPELNQSPTYYSEDFGDKSVEESIQVGKLHTKVDYSRSEGLPRSNEYSGKIKESGPVPVIAKVFPYPVEQIVEKEVKVPVPIRHVVEKIVHRPVEVEKIVDRPVPVPYFVPVDRIVETPVHIPYPVEQIVEVEKLIETQVPIEIEKFIDRPVPVHVEKIVNRPYPVEKIVEKVVNRPVPVHIPVKVPVRVPVPVHIPVHISIPSGYFSSTHQPTSANPTSNNQNVQKNFLNLEYQQTPLESEYSPAYSLQQNFPEDINRLMKQKEMCKKKQQLQVRYAKKFDPSEFQVFNHLRDDYFGPVPTQNEYSHWGGQNFKRSPEFGRNLRMEYGFKPPLIPSIEIDDQGLPINRNKDS